MDRAGEDRPLACALAVSCHAARGSRSTSAWVKPRRDACALRPPWRASAVPISTADGLGWPWPDLPREMRRRKTHTLVHTSRGTSVPNAAVPKSSEVATWLGLGLGLGLALGLALGLGLGLGQGLGLGLGLGLGQGLGLGLGPRAKG